jgi:2-oxoglutarate ferredoxin oxidoreductase subunit delta
MGAPKMVVVNKEWCKGCGICVAFCPKKVLDLVDDVVDIARPEDCIKCGQCELRCPDFAIYLKEVPENVE